MSHCLGGHSKKKKKKKKDYHIEEAHDMQMRKRRKPRVDKKIRQ